MCSSDLLHEPLPPKNPCTRLKRMQEAWHIHISHDPGRVEPGENIAERPGVFGKNATRVVVFMKAFQPLVAYRPDHF